ncbi:crotonase/enoyl-CoA hydratase family protein [Amycolatopsis thermoflava]|uniref:crotonase/enoyl-CoA hydratase family protein n=1 Tax=Amycolatopsis thermoflava TaxID=84480 RepID=UPI0038047C65
MTATEAPPAGLLVECRGNVVLLKVDRPERRNAIDLPTATAIARALDAFDADDDLRAAVFTGTGGFFSAGMDLKAYSETGDRPIDPGRGGFGIVARPPRKPIIAAVEGAALGGGLEIALACDLVVAAEGARFGLPEVKRGLLASGGGLLRLPALIPRNIAMEVSLTGAPLSARRCAELGLVNQVVADGGTLDAALELATAIADNAPLPVQESKRILIESADWPAAEQFARQEPYVERVRRSEDAREGAAAFLEKRPPRWRNR